MKKITLFILFLMTTLSSFSQTDFYTALPNDGGNSANGRSPQAVDRYNRSIWLITAAEMTAAGFVSGNVLNSVGFTLLVPSEIAATGTFVVYLQNTTDTTNTKSTTWATAITGMTTASNGSLTIPATAGSYDILFGGGSPFTFTGGALYVAFDYQNASGALPTMANSTSCNGAGLIGGLKGARSITAAPATVAASNFRPETRLGKAVSCQRPNMLNVSSFTNTSATATWVSPPGASSDIENVLYDANPTGVPTVTGISSPYTISGLSPSTAYEYYVRSNCGGMMNSAWNGPFSYNTVFSPSPAPYTTSFEAERPALYGWSLPVAPASTADWTSSFFGPTSGVLQDGNYVAFSITPVAAANNWFMSRGVNLTLGSSATVSYFVRNFTSTGVTTAGNYKLSVGNANTIAAQTTPIFTETNLTNTAYIQKTFTFTPTFTGTHYFGFLNNTPGNATGTHAIFIDSFSVSEVPLRTNDFLANQFSVSPNPSANFVNVTNSINAIVTSIEISDMNGRIVKSDKIANLSDFKISISELSQGIYTLKIIADKGSLVKRIIKE